MIKTIRALLEGTDVKNVCIPPAHILPDTNVACMNEVMIAIVTAAYSFLVQQKPDVDARELNTMYRLLIVEWRKGTRTYDAVAQEAAKAAYFWRHCSDENIWHADSLAWFTANSDDVKTFTNIVATNIELLSPFNME